MQINNFKLLRSYTPVMVVILSMIFIASSGLFVSYAQAAQSISVRIVSSSDDAEEQSSGSVDLTSSDLELIREASEQTVGLRFQNITIPPDATIVSASIIFTVDEISSSEQTNLDFFAEASDNAGTFSTTTNNVSSRPVTTAAVSWLNIPIWNEVGVAHQTPDLTPIIQEVIDRPGWTYGNSVVCIITGGLGKRVAESYNGSPTQAPLLQLEFTTEPDLIPPSTPTELTATALTSSRIKLLWNAATDNIAVSGYTIYSCPEISCPTSTVIGTTTATTYSDQGLTANTLYTYRVEAFDSDGNASTASTAVSATTLAAGQVTFYTLVGAGDIVTSSSLTSANEATAQILDGIVADDPDTTVFTAGDNVYSDGTAEEFAIKYAATWGRHRARTYPSPGNHDYNTQDATGYLDYFCPSSSDCVFPGGTQQRYYSYDLGDWHIISLDSSMDNQAGSAQIAWLQQDLAAHPNSCILAYMHYPYYSSGRHGSSTRPTEFWRELYAAGADIVVAGHDHIYERFAKQDLNGNVDPSGIRAFVAGTGGAGLYTFDNPIPNSEVKNNDTYGVISFTLLSGSYSWEFIPVAGSVFSDTGSDICNNPVSNDPRPTISITNPVDGAEVAATVSITADATDDNVVTQVEFFINGVLIETASTMPYATDWDSTSVSDGNYTISATVYDDAGQTTSDSINVAVNNIDEPPVAVDDIASTFQGVPVTIDVAANDSDPDGNLDETTTNIDTEPVHGTLNNNGNGSFEYIPNQDFIGIDSFVYVICDGLGACDTATVTITITPMILDVRVGASSDDAEEKSNGKVSLSGNDLELVYDRNNQTVGMRFIGITIPQSATISNAYIQFQVDEQSTADLASLIIQGEAADNAVTFSSSNGNISSRPRTTAAVSWGPGQWPLAGEAGVNQQTADIATIIQETINRPGWSSGNALGIIITGTGKRVAESYNGSQSGAPLLHIEYNIGPPNDPPVANDDSVSTPEDMPVSIDVAANDSDPEGNLGLTTTNTVCVGCFAPVNGLLVNNSNGSFDYTPNLNFNGSDSFVYEICDSQNACDTATVDITVIAIADPPLATDDSVNMFVNTMDFIIDVASNDSDPDGNLDEASTNIVCDDICPFNGTLVNNGDGSFNYDPEGFIGSDSFVYEICDTDDLCDTATVTITVQPNQPPTVGAGPDQEITLPNDSTLSGTSISDDGQPNPPGEVTTAWSQQSGPEDAVTFTTDDVTGVTTASFSVDGAYVLRLTADDSELQSFDELTITVLPQQAITTLEIRVSSGNDDAEERVSTGSTNLNSSDLELVDDGRSSKNQIVGMRFNGISIPPGATINSAFVQFQADEKDSKSTSLTIEGEAIDNALSFTSANGNISSRARTGTAIAWAPVEWPAVGDDGPAQQTPDIAAVIQEIVNRQGWMSSNSLVIIITGTGERTAESFNGAPAAAPLLHIEYQ